MSAIPGQTYRGSMRRPIRVAAKIGLLHALLLVSVAVAALVWGVTLISGARGYDLMKFISLLGIFGVACAFFLVSRSGEGFASIFEIPVFMTLVAFLEFGIAPLASFADPSTLFLQLHGDTSTLYPALQIVILGMVAFWLGAELARSRKRARAVQGPPPVQAAGRSTLTLGLGGFLYAASFAVKVYMMRAGMYSFLGSLNVYYTHLAQAQIFMTISSFGFDALILFTIEAYFHPGDEFRKWAFRAVFASECFWGLFSGMKSALLINFMAVALVASLATKKLRLRWLAVAILGLIVIYPLVNRYREVSSRTSSDESTRFSAASQAMQEAAERSAEQERTARGYLQSGWSASVERVNMLACVALIMSYKDQAYRLEGDERLWMLPIWAFVPRFIWRDKPVLDVGAKVTQVMTGGANATSSTAITIPGDLYLRYNGIIGILGGMFALGLAAQWLTNPVKLLPSKRNIFIYGCIFFPIANWEADFFGLSGGLIRAVVILHILAWILYGPAQPPSALKANRATAGPGTETGK
jgi:hypothetical protein